ncbi:helix-turn-helix transcriptional regulator [Paenibacillus methanolicus]|uniref:AraC-like DNA-binding protein n=1 Tax=Paenibacillus methanolicus TaxID=582686 RepID=A0A5S5CDK8_9BACL|nr:AraC family transcriptional regulator [Paenibacillus methanolicus]TYP76406.1 AraC-like DNA-binding protein [Paenibacillus methanolicus]
MNESAERIVSFDMPAMPYYAECGKTVYAPGEQHPNRRNLGLFDLLVVENGTLHIGEEERQWAVEAGQSLLLLPDRYHYAAKPCETATVFFWLHFHAAGAWRETDGIEPPPPALPEAAAASPDAAYSPSSPYTVGLPKYAALVSPKQTFLQLEKLLRLHQARRSESFWEQQTLFQQLLRMYDETLKQSSASPALHVAERTEAYIKQHYREPITNARLGEALHFHPGYIVRCMKETYRCTPMDYLLYYRIERAKLLLLKTELPVAAVAEAVGFSQTPYFSVCFKQQTGLAPLQFRKQYSHPKGAAAGDRLFGETAGRARAGVRVDQLEM